ncbi:MAG: recombinase family protein [Kiritimatiellae bacterium]|nr:recombinase family protein [Kiritimatiellia bacterium]
MTYGYVRVSTKEQIVDRQLAAMKTAGVTNITIEKASGKDFDRPQYQTLKKKLVRGDLLVVQSLDRFGRNYDDIIDEWRYLVKTVGVDVKVLDMPLLDTRQGEGLIGRFVGDIVLQILSFVAETERMKIKERQAQGIKCAKERGVKFGRPRANIPDNMDELLRLYGSGRLTLREAASEAGMSNSTFHRAAVGAGIRPAPVRRVRSPGRMAEKAEAPRPAEKDGKPSVEWVMSLPPSERWQYARHRTPADRRRAQEIERSRW